MYAPESASSATMEDKKKLSPPSGLRSFASCGVPLLVPMYTRCSSGSYVIAFHTVPPPPRFHHVPVHVLAAIAIAAFSNLFSGLPGTVLKRQSCRPLLASYAVTYPRIASSSWPGDAPHSEEACAMTTLPSH